MRLPLKFGSNWWVCSVLRPTCLQSFLECGSLCIDRRPFTVHLHLSNAYRRPSSAIRDPVWSLGAQRLVERGAPAPRQADPHPTHSHRQECLCYQDLPRAPVKICTAVQPLCFARGSACSKTPILPVTCRLSLTGSPSGQSRDRQGAVMGGDLDHGGRGRPPSV